MDKKTFTRIDIERLDGQTLSVDSWLEGWQEGQSADRKEIIQGRSIESLLFEFEKRGYTVEMASNSQGRALCGKTTRIDFIKLAGKFYVKKFPFGWTAKTRPIQETEKTEAEWEKAILWCESNGWNVRRWPDGARAWMGPVLPVRDAAGIRAMRRKAEAEFQRLENIGTNKIFYDFAFDF
jgi:hypothetical protein